MDQESKLYLEPGSFGLAGYGVGRRRAAAARSLDGRGLVLHAPEWAKAWLSQGK